MAREFVRASNEYLQVELPAVTAFPAAMACWFWPNNLTDGMCLMWAGDKDYNTREMAVFAAGHRPGTPVRSWYRSDNGFAGSDTANYYAANQWHHACAMHLSTNDRRSYLNGDIPNRGHDTTSVIGAPTAYDRTAIGSQQHILPTSFRMDGRIAMAGIWDLSGYPGATDSLKGDYFESHVLPGLAAGWSPLAFPVGLQGFWPLGGLDTEETDGGIARCVTDSTFDMTAFSDATGPGIADHPGGLVYPTGPLFVSPSADDSAIMNQIQFANIGADLYNGTLI